MANNVSNFDVGEWKACDIRNWRPPGGRHLPSAQGLKENSRQNLYLRDLKTNDDELFSMSTLMKCKDPSKYSCNVDNRQCENV